MSKTLNEYRQQYQEQENDPKPEKPPRIWVSVVHGKPTKKGMRFIKDERAWELRFLTWYHNEIVE